MALAAFTLVVLGLSACGGSQDAAVNQTPTLASPVAADAAAPTRAALGAPGIAEPIGPAAVAAAEAPIAIFAGRGEPVSVAALRTVGLNEVLDAVAVPGARVGGVNPRYSVQTWRIHYVTLDGAAKPIVASGLMAAPVKPAGSVSPVLSYQHGTVFLNADAPSNAVRGSEAPIVLASLGYIVVAADYVGYGVSKGAPHPYLLAQPGAAAVNDLITAARIWRQGTNHRGNGQLFLLGYSEGGYTTAAALREMHAMPGAHRSQLVAAVAGGGPQDVGTTLDHALGRVKDRNILLAALINPGFLRHLGSTVRDEVRRAMMRELLPDESDVVFQSTFLDFFLNDDQDAIARHCDVLDWASAVPYRLFHGRDDRTVHIASSQSALKRSLAAGTPASLVNLTDCTASPADHLPCVPEFFRRSAAYLADLARDL